MNIAGRGEGGRNKVDSGRETKEGNGCKQLSRRAKPLCLYFDFMKSALLFFSLLFSSLLGYRRYVHVHDSSPLSLTPSPSPSRYLSLFSDRALCFVPPATPELFPCL